MYSSPLFPCAAVDQNFVFLRGFFRELLCLLINRPRARRRARAREAINPIQSWIVGMTAKGAAIRRTTRCHVAGRRRRSFAEPPLGGLKPGSTGGSPYRSPSEDMSHEPHPSAKTGADEAGGTSGRTKPGTIDPSALRARARRRARFGCGSAALYLARPFARGRNEPLESSFGLPPNVRFCQFRTINLPARVNRQPGQNLEFARNLPAAQPVSAMVFKQLA